MKKLYIFDLDGTLVNSLYDLGEAVNTVLARHGWAVHDMEKYRYFVGNGTLKLIERALPDGEKTPERIAEIHEEFAAEYAENLVKHTAPYDGIRELVTELKKRGALLAVASNKPDRFSKKIVETLFGKGFFDKVYGKREGVPTKPEPQIMLDIMNELGIKAEDCIHSGDSNVDVATAHNAGVKCIGCTWGFRTEEELLEAGADYIADSAEDILALTEAL
ncbi:MAG: HAD family hydrolase [Ruminococcus sp.]|uniref:HAD family hydrolase n=1 Tax=Ruminococcus sp. TaxID=41978 RepID=UPI0025F01458|nr:HAD family hydrolase [Ruminococcus sp.]MBR0529396.1 HAD family hydrolase [Ruminococcus sp.]